MNGHVISVLCLLTFSIGLHLFLRLMMRRGRPAISAWTLYATLVFGTLTLGGRFVQTMGGAEWVDGLVGFITLSCTIASAHAIRRICPSCHHGLTLEDSVANPPTRAYPGAGIALHLCTHCAYNALESHTIPRLAETSAEAIPWSPDGGVDAPPFGAHYAIGSSGSYRWRTPQDDVNGA